MRNYTFDPVKLFSYILLKKYHRSAHLQTGGIERVTLFSFAP